MTYFVYIIASRSKNLYTGVTNDLQRRTLQHKSRTGGGFTAKYRIERLVYFELFGDVKAAISREKEIKAWRREKRLALIESQNPAWQDQYDALFGNGKITADPSPAKAGFGMTP
jgi:putative endonuclease